MLANDSLFHEATLFDQFFRLIKQRVMDSLPTQREQRWGLLFLGLGLLFKGCGLIYLTTGVLQPSATAVVAHLFCATLLGLAGLHFRKLALQLQQPIAPSTQSAPKQHPPIRQFFKAVRAAGVNVSIARALYTGGIHSVTDLRNSSDQALLAIHGVGPATVRRLRVHFNFVATEQVI